MNSRSAAAPRRFRRYPAYKGSGVEWLGEIPAHWDRTRLKRVFSVVNGSTPQSGVPEYWDGEIPWVTPEDLGDLDTSEIQSTRRLISHEGYRSCGTSLVPAGSLLLSTRAPIGHLAIAGLDVCTNQGCRSLVFCRESVRKFFFFQLVAARPELESWGQGSTFRELAKDKLEEVFIAEPPDDEQRAIVAFLDRETARIDALVAKKERLIELLQEKRTALITRAVTKGLAPNVPMKDSGVEWLGEIPAHWELVPSTWLFTESKQRARDGDQQLSATQKYGVIPQAEFERLEGRQVVHAFLHLDLRKHVEVNDFVMSMRSFEGGLERVRAPGCVRSSYVVLRSARQVNVGYFSYLFKSSAYIQALRATSTFIRDGQDLNFENFRLVNLPVVPSSEQRTITAFLDRGTARIDALVSKIREAIDRLKEFRTALISAAVTGKMDVRGLA